MKTTEQLRVLINKAHGDGNDTIELYIEDVRSILTKLQLAEAELDWTFNREGWVRTGEVLKELRK